MLMDNSKISEKKKKKNEDRLIHISSMLMDSSTYIFLFVNG